MYVCACAFVCVCVCVCVVCVCVVCVCVVCGVYVCVCVIYVMSTGRNEGGEACRDSFHPQCLYPPLSKVLIPPHPATSLSM